MAEWFTAIGTLFVCFVAVFGDWLREVFFHPKLILIVPDYPPALIKFKPPRYYLHLCIENRGNITAKGCRVLLREMYMEEEESSDENRFALHHVPFTLQFTWSPSEMPPLQRDVPRGSSESIGLGFIVLSEGETKKFQPQFYVTPCGYDYSVPAGRKVRYSISVVADNYFSSKPQVFEIFWDGTWDDKPEAMRNHLQIYDVTESLGKSVVN